MTQKNISVIIVTFNSERYIRKCVKSVLNSDIDKYDLRIMIVDNSSKDKTRIIVNKICQNTNQVSLIKNKDNIGFAAAINQGIKLSMDSNYVLLLNPDTLVEENSISRLIECSIKNNAGICGGSTRNITGVENGSYFRSPNLLVGIFDFTNFRKLCTGDKWHKYFYYLLDNDKKKSTSYSVDVVTGGYMLINRESLTKIGLFDERFFMYLEDVDYCERAKLLGIRIFHTEDSRIIHIGGASSTNKDKVNHLSWIRSRKIYFLKHFGLIKNIIIQPIFLVDDIVILLLKSLHS